MRIIPKGHHIIVAWQDFDLDERGRQMVPGSLVGLTYGREVHPPVAVVLDVGPDVVGITPGMRIIATKHLGELVESEGLQVQAMALMVRDPRTERLVPTDEVVAVLEESGPRATGRRVVGRVVAPELSDVIDVEITDGAERIEVLSVGPDVVGIGPGDVVVVPHGSSRRVEWSDAGTSYVSVVGGQDGAVIGVETPPLAPHFEAPGGTQCPKKCANPGELDGG